MTSRKHANLVGSVMSVVAADVSHAVEKAFGWDLTPPIEAIIRHLANVVKSYDPREKVLLAEMARTAYDVLSKHDVEEVRGLLAEHIPSGEWLWHGEGFTVPQGIVFNAPFMDLRSFVCSLRWIWSSIVNSSRRLESNGLVA